MRISLESHAFVSNVDGGPTDRLLLFSFWWAWSGRWTGISGVSSIILEEIRSSQRLSVHALGICCSPPACRFFIPFEIWSEMWCSLLQRFSLISIGLQILEEERNGRHRWRNQDHKQKKEAQTGRYRWFSFMCFQDVANQRCWREISSPFIR